MAGKKLASLRQGFFVAFHGDVEVVLTGAYAASCIQSAKFLFQLLRLISTHDTGVVHQVRCNTQFREITYSDTITECKAEYVVFRILRIIHLGAVIQLFALYLAEVEEFLFHLSDRHILELCSIQRLFAYRRFDGFVTRFLDFCILVQLAFFNVDGQVIVGQVLFGNTLDIFCGNSHYLIFVVENLSQVFFTDKGLHQREGFGSIRFHHQVEVTTHVVLDSIDLPFFELSVGDFLDSFQCFLFSALVRFETTLVFIVQWGATYDIAALFAAGVCIGITIGQFTVDGQFVQRTGAAAVAQQGHGDFQGFFIGVSGRYAFVYEAYIGVITDFSIILLATFNFKVRISFTFRSSLSR